MMNVQEIKDLAKKIRMDVLDITYKAGVNGGHIGGALSSADILAVLYGHILNISKDNLHDDQRDRFILSKGHIALGHYAALAEVGIITKDEMFSFEVSGSDYQTHENMNTEKGIEFSGGSLGYGASLGCGTALMAKIRNKKYHTFVLMGDGECNEGTVWEALMFASRYELDNLTFIIDVNQQQLDGYTSEVVPVHSFLDVCKGFGCFVQEIDGHSYSAIIDSLGKIEKNKPRVIIANTIKGKGIPSVEGQVGLHHVRLTDENYVVYRKEMEQA